MNRESGISLTPEGQGKQWERARWRNLDICVKSRWSRDAAGLRLCGNRKAGGPLPVLDSHGKQVPAGGVGTRAVGGPDGERAHRPWSIDVWLLQ